MQNLSWLVIMLEWHVMTDETKECRDYTLDWNLPSIQSITCDEVFLTPALSNATIPEFEVTFDNNNPVFSISLEKIVLIIQNRPFISGSMTLLPKVLLSTQALALTITSCIPLLLMLNLMSLLMCRS